MTASQELADLLMRKYKLPFRDGHHFASEVVAYAKTHGIKPLDFPYAEARRIYAESQKDSKYGTELPMSEAEFRAALDPVAIVNSRATRRPSARRDGAHAEGRGRAPGGARCLDQSAPFAHTAGIGRTGSAIRRNSL